MDGCPGCLAMVASELDADDALGGVLASAIFARLDVRLLLLPFPRLYFLPDDFFSPLDSLLLEYDRENGKGGGAGEQKGPPCSTVATVATPVIIVSPPVVRSPGVSVAPEYSAMASFGKLGSNFSISGGVPPSLPQPPNPSAIPPEPAGASPPRDDRGAGEEAEDDAIG